MKIELGNTYEDAITGFTGVATGHVEYITGCHQTLLTPKALDNKPGEPFWVDDDRLAEVPAEKITLPNRQRNGCDKPAPIR